jgi:hypothetical protein
MVQADLNAAILARDNLSTKVRELKIQLTEYDTKTEIIREENSNLKEKLTAIEVDNFRRMKEFTGMKLQLDEQKEKNDQLIKKIQEETLQLKFSSTNLKQEQQHNAKITEQNKLLTEKVDILEQTLYGVENKLMLVNSRIQKSDRHRMFIAIRLAFMIKFGRNFIALFQKMIEDKLAEFESLYKKYFELLPKFNKLSDDNMNLLQDKERLTKEVD